MLEEMLQSRSPSSLTRSFTEVTTVAPKTELAKELRKSAAVQIYQKKTMISSHEEVNEFEAELATPGSPAPENVED